MKLTLACKCDHGEAGDVVDIECPAQAHVMMADGLAVRQRFPRSKEQIAKKLAKCKKAKKKAKKK